MAGLRDPSVRLGWMRDRLLSVNPMRAADVVSVVLARAEQREPLYNALMLCVSLTLSAPDLQATRRALGHVALARGQRGLARLFAHAPQADSAVTTEEASDEPAPRKEVFGISQSPSLPLGTRKSLARRRDRQMLSRALRDSHPEVIRILLDNPAVVEADVIRMCARRPIAAAVLETVFRHCRWITRHGVQRAIALNPHTPELVTLQLLPHLTANDLREVAASATLSDRVREACFESASAKPVH